MSTVRAGFVVLFLVFVSAHSVSADIIWGDGFETDTFDAWTSASGNWDTVSSALSAHSGSLGADVRGASMAGGDTLSLSTSTLGYENIQLSYWYKIREGLESADSVKVEWSDGSAWSMLATYTDVAAGDWQLEQFALPLGASNNPDFSLRLIAELGSSGDRMNFDDFALSGTVVPEPAMFVALAPALFLLLRKRRLV